MSLMILAIILGLFFGFVLQKAGAANPQRIIGMLTLKDFHLMKAILLAIGVSSLFLFIGLSAGLIDIGHISVKSTYVGVVVGGAILGLGWALAGFCPGTGVVAAGAGRKDAWFFIVGGLVGAFLFTVAYPFIKDTVLFSSLGNYGGSEFGGKVTLVVTGNDKYPALLPDYSALAIAGGIAVIFIAIAFLLPTKKR